MRFGPLLATQVTSIAYEEWLILLIGKGKQLAQLVFFYPGQLKHTSNEGTSKSVIKSTPNTYGSVRERFWLLACDDLRKWTCQQSTSHSVKKGSCTGRPAEESELNHLSYESEVVAVSSSWCRRTSTEKDRRTLAEQSLFSLYFSVGSQVSLWLEWKETPKNFSTGQSNVCLLSRWKASDDILCKFQTSNPVRSFINRIRVDLLCDEVDRQSVLQRCEGACGSGILNATL